MTTVKRKILFYFFVALFLILSPAIALYASGYQMDWNNLFSPLAIQKTGMLLIESEPSEADIYLNGKRWKKISLFPNGKDSAVKTPIKIKTLPGSYDLKVELEGYWPWERRIKIYPAQITHVLDVRLFKKSLPESLIEAADISAVFGKKKIFLPQSGILYDLKSHESANISSSSQPLAFFSPDENKILLQDSIINFKSPEKSINLRRIIGAIPDNFKWDGSNPEKIYYQSKGSLFHFNTKTSESETIATENKIVDYLPKNGKLYYIAAGEISAELLEAGRDKNQFRALLPISEDYVFTLAEDKNISVLDKKNQVLRIYDPYKLPLEARTIYNVKYAARYNEEFLFLADDFEISQFNEKDDRRRALIRLSEPIFGISKTADPNYLIYWTARGIYALTWDEGNEMIQSTELAKMEAVNDVYLNESDSTVYFIGRFQGRNGLFKLGIK